MLLLIAISSKDKLNKRVEDIINTIIKAIKAFTPKAKLSLKLIYGWTKEYKAA